MRAKTLTELYRDRSHFMVTAHRGASFEFPENTALAMRKAVEAGADMIEFDLRGTADGVPVLLHDETIDRTSDGRGMPEEHSLDELKKLNFSFWLQGMRREAPVYEVMEIPTFEEILSEFRDKAAMNIQLYAKTDALLVEICRLFRRYDMYDRGYFTVCPDLAARVRAIDPDIELCTTRGWRERSLPENLKLCREADGCRFVQPVREFTDADAFLRMRELGLRGNVFFTDAPAEMLRLQSIGAEGILTNQPHRMCRLRGRSM